MKTLHAAHPRINLALERIFPFLLCFALFMVIPPAFAHGDDESQEMIGDDGVPVVQLNPTDPSDLTIDPSALNDHNSKSPQDLIKIQIIDFSDWHCQLLSPFNLTLPTVVNNVATTKNYPVGGTAQLKGYIDMYKAQYPDSTLVFTAGDDFHATPPSCFFADRIRSDLLPAGTFPFPNLSLPVAVDSPAIDVENLIGLTANTLGNHNFDLGIQNLLSLTSRGNFPRLVANIPNEADFGMNFAPYQIVKVGPVKVAIIGLANDFTPSAVADASTLCVPSQTYDPNNPQCMHFLDAATAVNALFSPNVNAAMAAQQQAKRQGADVFIIIYHQGAQALIDLANNVSGFDLIIGDHSDQQVNRVINGQLVIENPSLGVMLSRVLLTYDRNQQKVVNTTVEQKYVLQDYTQLVPPLPAPTAGPFIPEPPIPAVNPTIKDYVTNLTNAEKPVLQQPIAFTNAPILANLYRDCTLNPNNTLSCFNDRIATITSQIISNIVSDAIRSGVAFGVTGVDFGFVGGRAVATLTCPLSNPANPPNANCPQTYTSPTGAPFAITLASALGAERFSSDIYYTVNISGAELKLILENSSRVIPHAFPDINESPSGLCYKWDITKPIGQRVFAVVRTNSDGTCNWSNPVDLSAGATYKIAATNFVLKSQPANLYPNLLDAAHNATHYGQISEVVVPYIQSLAAQDPDQQLKIIINPVDGPALDNAHQLWVNRQICYAGTVQNGAPCPNPLIPPGTTIIAPPIP